MNTYYTHSRLKSELDYRRAHRIAELLLKERLITPEEFSCLKEINLQTFPPLFSEIVAMYQDQSDV